MRESLLRATVELAEGGNGKMTGGWRICVTARKVRNYPHAIAPHFRYCNFDRIHKTLRPTAGGGRQCGAACL